MKYAIWGVWFGAAAMIVLGSGWLVGVGQITFWSMLLVHGVEFLVKRPLFERAGGSMGHHFVQTLIYGLFHWKPIQDRLEGAPKG